MKHQYLIAYLVSIMILASSSLWAADHRNLEEGNPTRLEDASVIAYRSIELQPVIGFTRGGTRGEIFFLEPEIKWGIVKNAQIEVRAPFFLGVGDRQGSGDFDIEALYNFNAETIWIPASAIRLGVTLPTGEQSSGLNTVLRGILSKGIERVRFHINGGITHIGECTTEGTNLSLSTCFRCRSPT